MCNQTHLAITELQNLSEWAKKQVSEQTGNISHVRLHAIQICCLPCFTLKQTVPMLWGWESPILNESILKNNNNNNNKFEQRMPSINECVLTFEIGLRPPWPSWAKLESADAPKLNSSSNSKSLTKIH